MWSHEQETVQRAGQSRHGGCWLFMTGRCLYWSASAHQIIRAHWGKSYGHSWIILLICPHITWKLMNYTGVSSHTTSWASLISLACQSFHHNFSFHCALLSQARGIIHWVQYVHTCTLARQELIHCKPHMIGTYQTDKYWLYWRHGVNSLRPGNGSRYTAAEPQPGNNRPQPR